MRELLGQLQRWQDDGRRVALARLVDLEGSGPRLPGAAMAVADDGEVVGSVTGGCVESAVVEAGLEVVAGAPAHLVTFGYSDDDAFAVGLTCGGTVHLYIEELAGWSSAGVELAVLAEAIRTHEPVVLVTIVDGPGTGSKLLVFEEGRRPAVPATLEGVEPSLARVIERDAAAVLASGATSVRRYGEHGEANEDTVTVSYEVHAPAPRLVIVGAVDFTAALSRVAKVLGYRVTVCDAREVFATPARFPLADEIVVDWPHRYLESVAAELGPRDAVCILTHDAKFDVPAIKAALATRVGYLGAMGSRRTTEERAERLREEGVTADQLQRLMAPIGLDLGARTPEETAVSICAEIIATRTHTDAPNLKRATGPIHPTAEPPGP